jgi:hypothetical protein
MSQAMTQNIIHASMIKTIVDDKVVFLLDDIYIFDRVSTDAWLASRFEDKL